MNLHNAAGACISCFCTPVVIWPTMKSAVKGKQQQSNKIVTTLKTENSHLILPEMRREQGRPNPNSFYF